MKLGLRALAAATEDKPTPQTVEVGVVEKGKRFRRLDEKELADLLSQI
jgi:20S proteasome alpha/beta subunit